MIPWDTRGFFETPNEIGTFLARWAITGPDDIVLEPCAGTGALAREAQSRLDLLGAKSCTRVIAVEKDKKLIRELEAIPRICTLHDDFLKLIPGDLPLIHAV